jgi:NAD(P)-dependent dehydrogenase (short-subunit alcohol dehydrogenase family)
MNVVHNDQVANDSSVWFVTGCSTGFGREIARHVLERGYRAVVTARNPDDLKEFVGRAHALVLLIRPDLFVIYAAYFTRAS